MSVRAAPTAPPPPTPCCEQTSSRVDDVLTLGQLVRQPADTKCGDFDTDTDLGMIGMPCGAIVSYGTSGTYEHAYVISTKSMATLDPMRTKLYMMSPYNMTKSMMAVKNAMSSITTLGYGNIYGYKPGVHTYELDHMDEMAYMSATHYPTDTGNMGKMFTAVHDVLKKEYPMGYVYTTFRAHGYTGSY